MFVNSDMLFFIALLKSKSEFADIIKIIKRSMKKEFLYYCFEKQIKIHSYSKNHQLLKTQYEIRWSSYLHNHLVNKLFLQIVDQTIISSCYTISNL